MDKSWLTLLLLTACADSCRVYPPDSADTRVEVHTAVVETADSADSADSGSPNDPDLAYACGTSEGSGVSPEAQTVVVLVTDGARIDETFGDKISSVTGEPTEDFWPSIRADLLPEGTLVLPGLATGVTITAEGHAALLTGSRVAQANFPSDDGPGMYRPEIPTLFERLSAKIDLPEHSTALLGNTVHLGGHGWSLHPSHGEELGAAASVFTQDNGQPVGSDTEVIDGVRQYLETHDARMVVVNLHQMDRSGHYNVSPTAYGEGVKAVDTAIVDFWRWIQSAEDYANQTLLVIVADHGRHRWNEAEDYRHHGDQCTGCRQIPMLMLGPGIREGHQVTSPYTIEDLGKTISWVMGVDLPHADGQILCEALKDPPATNGRSGVASIHVSGDVTAEAKFGEKSRVKSSVYSGEELLSSEDAIHAEAPVAWSTSAREGVCWRELGPGPESMDAVETWAWEARCVERPAEGQGFTEMILPLDAISPYWVPSLAEDTGGRLWMAFSDNDSGNWEAPDQSVRLLRQLSSGAWEGLTYGIGAAYPMEPSLVMDGDIAWVAFAASNDQTDPSDKKAGRFLRHVEVWSAQWPASTSPTWTQHFRTRTAEDDPSLSPDMWERMERPALHVDEQGVQVGFIAIDAIEGNTVAWAASDIDGTWSSASPVDNSGRVLAHITPRFTPEGVLTWLRHSESETVELCAWTPGRDSPVCSDTGALWARGLEIAQGSALAVLSWGSSHWDDVSVEIPDVFTE
jgi:hypothetical protein